MSIDDDRAEFELRLPTTGFRANVRNDGKYDSSHTQIMWEAWQAARQGWQPIPTEQPVECSKAFVKVVAALAASISLLERSPKKGAASNTMFDIMLDDYRKALEKGRAALSSAFAEREAVSVSLEKCAAAVFKCDPSYDEETGLNDTWVETSNHTREYCRKITKAALDAAKEQGAQFDYVE